MLKLIHCVSVTAHPLSVSQPIHCQCHGPSIVSVMAHPLSVLRPIHCQCSGPPTVSDTVLESVLQCSTTAHPMSDRAIGSSALRSIRCQCSSPALQFIQCRIGQPIHRQCYKLFTVGSSERRVLPLPLLPPVDIPPGKRHHPGPKDLTAGSVTSVQRP